MQCYDREQPALVLKFCKLETIIVVDMKTHREILSKIFHEEDIRIVIIHMINSVPSTDRPMTDPKVDITNKILTAEITISVVLFSDICSCRANPATIAAPTNATTFFSASACRYNFEC